MKNIVNYTIYLISACFSDPRRERENISMSEIYCCLPVLRWPITQRTTEVKHGLNRKSNVGDTKPCSWKHYVSTVDCINL